MIDLKNRVKARGRRLLNRRLHRRPCTLRLPTPVISFTFDDFPASAYRTGSPVLRSYDAYGTYYASLGRMGERGDLGRMFELGDLRGLIEEGHELACHTYDHVRCSRTRWPEYGRNAMKNLRTAADWLSDYRLRNFAFPFGDVRLPHKKGLSRLFRSMRGIEQGLNVGATDLNLLRGVRLYSRAGMNPAAFHHIEENRRQKGWLIFFTHDVCENPSAFGCTPEDLEAVVRHARDSGALLITVDQALDFARVSREPPVLRERP